MYSWIVSGNRDILLHENEMYIYMRVSYVYLVQATCNFINLIKQKMAIKLQLSVLLLIAS